MISKRGDYIITDPYYISPYVIGEKTQREKWDYDDMGKYGFTEYICDGTLYGDWGCTVFSPTKPILSKTDLEIYVEKIANALYGGDGWINGNDEVIGHFCAERGRVCVVSRLEALQANPKAELWKKYPDAHYDEEGHWIWGECAEGTIYDTTRRDFFVVGASLSTKITDFEGEIWFYDFNLGDETHRVVLGYGNYSFYSLQTQN